MDKNTPFPECAKNCEVVKMLGVGECESVCGHKFDTSGMQLTIPDVVNQERSCETCIWCASAKMCKTCDEDWSNFERSC